MVTKFHLGGLILVGFTADDPTGATNPTTNVESPKQVRELTAGLQQAAAELPGGAPLLIGTDQEYGVVTRVKDGVTMLPSAMAFGAAGTAASSPRRPGSAAGAELAAMGINVDFAPVADTLGPGGSAVIGSRSFGADAKANAAQVAAAVRGLQGGRGRGRAQALPGARPHHRRQPRRAARRRAEPGGLGQPGPAAVRRRHRRPAPGWSCPATSTCRALDKGVAATFSRKVMTDLLRTELKFTGVAVTDAMNMAPAMKWPPGEAAVRALNGRQRPAAHAAGHHRRPGRLLAALKDGSLPRARLVEAVTRILTLKFRTAGQPQPELSTLKSPDHERAVYQADAASVTVLRGALLRPAGQRPGHGHRVRRPGGRAGGAGQGPAGAPA